MLNIKHLTQYNTRSGWNALLPPRVPCDQKPAKTRFASIVIGAGYTGLAAARRSAELEPAKEVLVLEASEIGEGPSGRNSGFVSVVPSKPMANAYGSAEDDALRKLRISLAGQEWLRSLIQEHNIDCDWDEESLRISAAATPKGAVDARNWLQSLRTWGFTCRVLSDEDRVAGLGTDYYTTAFDFRPRALVQPAALIRGLAASLPANVTLLERTLVTRVEGTGPFQVQSTKGTFTADRLFIANNAQARDLGMLPDRTVTILTYAALTPPLDGRELAKLGAAPIWGMTPIDSMGMTMRKLKDRFLVRSMSSYGRETDPKTVRNELTRLYRNRYPRMNSHAFEYVWGGSMAFTGNGGFFFGEARPNVFGAVGCNATGVVRGTINGKLLAELACRSQSQLLTDRLRQVGPNWLPPEPFRGIGAMSRMAWLRHKAGREY
ncbi:FAD-binding oxidoreductase [Bradyrhizobium sp. 23]|uniref:NAD(P)/FAD-dependent oxidoreductase n=1 Tax=Bradyrhizobium sp. 23 TaxID=2782667 RepID=UPI001FF73375|nr:FAD-binding oxidoreductase [Bradyrhizobium sp. 23]MCK1315476.1 FAD-binding oxidoreductase [Bradyrhizobium sp. 23]